MAKNTKGRNIYLVTTFESNSMKKANEDQNEKIINGFKHIRYDHESYSAEEMIRRSDDFHQWLDRRRSIREFSDRHVPKEVIENVIQAASTAPSGAHKQPWTFCAVSNSALKSKIREAAEKEEKESRK